MSRQLDILALEPFFGAGRRNMLETLIHYSRHRWTVDTPEDLDFVRAVYARLKDQSDFLWQDILALLEREPQLMELNASVMQKALREG